MQCSHVLDWVRPEVLARLTNTHISAMYAETRRRASGLVLLCPSACVCSWMHATRDRTARTALKYAQAHQAMRIKCCTLSCAAGGGWASLRPTTFHTDTAMVLLDAMQAESVNRLIAITSSGVEHNPSMPWWYRWMVRPLLMHTYRDMQSMENAIEAEAGLQWTLVRPGYLADAESVQHRVQDRRCPARGWWVSRIGAAQFMLHEAAANQWVHKHPALAM